VAKREALVCFTLLLDRSRLQLGVAMSLAQQVMSCYAHHASTAIARNTIHDK
jgi:hypothetical protein